MYVRRSVVTAIAAMLAGAGDASASGYAIREQSAVGQGSSFAGATARADDPSFMFFNPASLGWLSGMQAAAVGSYIRPESDVESGTATRAKSLGVQLAGKTGTVNDHTDVWFIGYTPTYVTGVWMGYPGRKKPLGNDMTGGHGALPFFVDFMKDFLKDKPKENFEKPPAMPEDMKELQNQRQREQQEENMQLVAERSRARREAEDSTAPSAITDPKLEQVTLPPAQRAETDSATAAAAPPASTAPRETAAPRTDALPPPSTTTRPREVEPPKKKGKKGTDEP